MTAELEAAKELLDRGEYTCVCTKADMTYSSKKRGVTPLLEWYEAGVTLNGFSAADRVVGKGAALLYVLLKVSAVYARVISKSALGVLKSNGICAVYEKQVDAILNRAGNGFCPVETALRDIDSAEAALPVIKATLAALTRN